jgi:hypothetical protein
MEKFFPEWKLWLYLVMFSTSRSHIRKI